MKSWKRLLGSLLGSLLNDPNDIIDHSKVNSNKCCFATGVNQFIDLSCNFYYKITSIIIFLAFTCFGCVLFFILTSMQYISI